MATRNFVPRADGEGKLGTPSKKWGDVYATTLHGDLDGNALSATLATNYLPLSGGAMTNTIGMRRNTDDSWVEIDGGTVYTNGAHIALYGKDINNGSDIPGAFRLIANNGVNSAGLIGKPNGSLIWNGNSLDKSAVVAESLGTNGYRKYASGLIEQWGSFRNVSEGYMPAGTYTVTFPISFTTVHKPIVSATDPVPLAIPRIAKNEMGVTFGGQVFELYWRAIGY